MSGRPGVVRRAGRVYRSLLLLYPPGVRRDGADEMASTFEARLHERLTRRGGRGAVVHLARTAADLAVNVPAAWLEVASPTLVRDEFAFAIRGLVRDRSLTLTLIPTLAVGIGAVTGFFSIVNAQLFRPLPYHEPERLVRFEAWGPGYGIGAVPVAALDVLRAEASFDRVGAYEPTRFNLGHEAWTDTYQGARVDAHALQALGVEPLLGRLVLADDVHTGREVGVLLGHRIWSEAFGRDPGVVGRHVLFEGSEVPVLGVMPEGFVFPERGELWAPFTEPLSTGRADRGVTALARLAPGTTLARADAEVSALAAGLAERGLVPDGFHITVLEDLFNRGRALTFLPWLLIGTGLAVLLVVCSNVASVLLARAARRQSEMAVRSALGASTGRLLGGALLEGAILASLGASLGLLLAGAGLDVFLAALGANFPAWFRPEIDGRVLTFTVAALTLSVLLFALPAGLQGARGSLSRTMATGGATATRARRVLRVRSTLIVVQVALSLVLVVGGALFATSALRLSTMDTGLDTDHAWELSFGLSGEVDEKAELRADFVRAVVERAATLPVVSHVASHGAPGGLRGYPHVTGDSLRAHEIEADGARARPVSRVVSPGYFLVSGIGLARGRDFGSDDSAGDALVAIVSEALAERLWPDGDALGRTIGVGGPAGVRAQIVGVARDERTLAGGGPRGGGMYARAVEHLYLPEAQAWITSPRVVLRASPAAAPGDLARLGAALRTLVREVDPHQAVAAVRPLGASDVATRRAFGMIAALLVGLAAVGAGLAVLGVWGLIAQSVAERRREIGVRAALGGSARRIVRGVMASGLRVTLIGVVVGLGLAALVGPVLAGFLYEIEPLDPAVLGGSGMAFVVIGLLAAWWPARQAARVDPVDALRAD